jgi:hypothetical protein
MTGDGQFLFSTEQVAQRLAVVSLFAPKVVFERFGPYRSARFGADSEFFEGLRARLGSEAVPVLPLPLLFGLSSATSLTRTPGMEAAEDGFRAPARRDYAAIAARTRHLNGHRDAEVEAVLSAGGHLLADAGVAEGLA